MSLVAGYSSDSGDEFEGTVNEPVKAVATQVSLPPTTSISSSSSNSLFKLPAPKNRFGPKKIIVESPSLAEKPDQPAKQPEPEASLQHKHSHTSIASLLPPSKNRSGSDPKGKAPNTQNTPNVFKLSSELSHKTRTLGGGASYTFDGEISVPTLLPQSTVPNSVRKVSLVPASVAARIAKYGTSGGDGANGANGSKRSRKLNSLTKAQIQVQPQQTHAQPSYLPTKEKKPENFGALFSLNSPDIFVHKTPVSDSSVKYQPVMIHAQGPSLDPEAYESSPSLLEQHDSLESLTTDAHVKDEINRLESRNGKRDLGAAKVVDFNMDEFYTANNELRKSGLLEENKTPVRTIGGGRHQLSGMLRNTTENFDRLEEMFAAGKRNKKESGSRYGF